jgi:hypothetical protein
VQGVCYFIKYVKKEKKQVHKILIVYSES